MDFVFILLGSAALVIAVFLLESKKHDKEKHNEI